MKLDVSLIYEVLGEIPAADVHPVNFGKLTGEWLEDEYGYCRCSICGYEFDDPETTTPYCPNCGAKMESEDKYMRLSETGSIIQNY